LIGGRESDINAKFLMTMIFKNGFVGDIAFSRKEEIFTKIPLALFLMIRNGVFDVFTRNPDL